MKANGYRQMLLPTEALGYALLVEQMLGVKLVHKPRPHQSEMSWPAIRAAVGFCGRCRQRLSLAGKHYCGECLLRYRQDHRQLRQRRRLGPTSGR